jgi:predicted ATPase
VSTKRIAKKPKRRPGVGPSDGGAPSLDEGTSFVGRRAEEAEIARLFEEGAKIVTLFGAGGMGKTRLAMRHAARIAEGRRDAVFFCDLSAARSLAAVVGVVGAAIDVALGDTADTHAAVSRVGHALAARKGGLIILDNVEGLEKEVSDALAVWLRSKDGPRYLLTSRTRLGRRDERCVAVGPLGAEDAVSLFEQRARAFVPDLVADAGVRALVNRLDQSPLAIELAAARAHVLSATALLARFAKHLDLVSSSRGDVASRHASLRAVVSASWDLCSECDRRSLAALTAFPGTFTLDAAEHVLEDFADGAGVVESLLAQSLLYRLPTSDGRAARYAIYASVRELAKERIVHWEGLDANSRRKHASYYLGLAAMHGPNVVRGVASAVDELAAEAENLLLAFETEPRQPLALDFVFAERLTLAAHIEILTEALSKTNGDRAPALTAELYLARSVANGRGAAPRATLDDAERAVTWARAAQRNDLEAHARLMRTVATGDLVGLVRVKDEAAETVAFARAHSETAVLASALLRLGWSLFTAGDLMAAEACADESLALASDEGLTGVQALGHNLLGGMALHRAHLEVVDNHFRLGADAASAARRWSDELLILGNRARVAADAGDGAAARSCTEAALVRARLGGFRRAEGMHLASYALSLIADGHLVEAHRRAVHAERILVEVGHRRWEGGARYALGTIALLEGKLDSASKSFHRCEEIGLELEDASLIGSSRAASAAVEARMGHFDEARSQLRAARDIVANYPDEIRSAVIDAFSGLVAAEQSRHELAEGRLDEAARSRETARDALDSTATFARASHEIRVVRRMLAEALSSLEGTPDQSDRAAPSVSSRQSAVSTRAIHRPNGESSSEVWDLYFDPLKCSVVIDGERAFDLRGRPVAARLLSVLLREPARRFDKAYLFEEVWHARFSTESQGATLYKAVDRLAKLLDPDPRRFLRWDEAGCLLVLAERPRLSSARPADKQR